MTAAEFHIPASQPGRIAKLDKVTAKIKALEVAINRIHEGATEGTIAAVVPTLQANIKSLVAHRRALRAAIYSDALVKDGGDHPGSVQS